MLVLMRKIRRVAAFESLNQDKFRTLEAQELSSVRGGKESASTLDTMTVTPSGCHNDGGDSWDGEDSGSPPPG